MPFGRRLWIILLLTATALSVRAELPHALHQVTEKVWSGAQPRAGEFADLRGAGFSTIVSVDGARPDLPGAKAQGLRYVHIPIGYDGISLEEAAAFLKAVRESHGKVFIHCHHGRHRGPAMAAIALRIEDPVNGAKRAEEFLKEAGTSPEYPGLWRCVREFDPAAIAGLSPELHEISPVSSLAEEMIVIDHRFEALVRLEKNGWKPLEDSPDLTPAQEALQLHERLQELLRADLGMQDAKLLHGTGSGILTPTSLPALSTPPSMTAGPSGVVELGSTPAPGAGASRPALQKNAGDLRPVLENENEEYRQLMEAAVISSGVLLDALRRGEAPTVARLQADCRACHVQYRN